MSNDPMEFLVVCKLCKGYWCIKCEAHWADCGCLPPE